MYYAAHNLARRTPESLFSGALLVHNHSSHKSPTFCLGTSGYAGSPNPSKEGVVYTDHSADDQRRNKQRELQQQALDLNAATNEATGSGNVNTDSRDVQNGQPPHRSGPAIRPPDPSRGIGSDESQIVQELRDRMQAMELEVRKLRKENAELRSTTRNPQPRGRTPPRRRSRSKSRSPPRRTQRPQTPREEGAIIVVRTTVNLPREGTVRGVGEPTGDTRGLEIGLQPRPWTTTLRSQVGS
ncbi:hypothetical protein PIB30_053455 [Stylosanthes scabra]|uniref:Uncharacterized protein n=1 Tax=Stylosanthes scabra TaxID=79078 RepID=A0ABU6TI90_9FABA|nr:hypothetical protein [Stylosanthes scabra]